MGDPKKQSFITFKHDTKNKNSIRSNTVYCLSQSNDQQLWVGTSHGMDLLDIRNQSFKHINLLQDLEISAETLQIYDILQTDNKIWIASSSGLILYNLNHHKGKLVHDFQQKDKGHTYVLDLHYSNNNKLWVGTTNGLFIINPDSLAIKRPHLAIPEIQASRIQDIAEDQQHNMWIATYHGLYRIDNSLTHIHEFKMNFHEINTLNDNIVKKLFIDSDNNVWIGTFTGGINLLSYRSVHFGLKRQLINQNQLLDSFIKAIYEDDENNLWLQNQTAVQRYKPHINQYDNPINRQDVFDNMNAMVSFNNDIWISTHSQGLYQYNINTNIIHQHSISKKKPTQLLSNHIHHLFPVGSDLWIDTVKGVVIYSSLTKNFKPFNPLNQLSASEFTPGNIIDIYTDSQGFTWISSHKGLLKFKNSKLITVYKYQKGNLQGINHNNVNSIEEDQSGQLWIATQNGLQKYHYENDTFESINLKNLTEGSIIQSITTDNVNRLWLGTNKGLVMFDPSSNKAHTFLQSDGLQGNQFSIYAKLLLKNGQLAFGGTKGFNIFNPEKVINQEIPKVYISQVKLDNSAPLIHIDKSIKLPYGENISLTLTTLDYHNPKDYSYSFILEGHHDKWINNNADNRTILLNNLSPGDYIFKAKAGNHNNIWSDEKTLLEITVLKPWWLKPYAYLGYLLLIIAFIYGIVQLQTSHLKKKSRQLKNLVAKGTQEIQKKRDFIEQQNHQLEELIAKKDKVFTNISHEFRTPLTLILSPLKNLLKIASTTQKESISLIMSNAYRLLRLVDQLLELSKIRSVSDNEIQSSQCYTDEVVNAVLPSFQTAAKEKQITLNATMNEKCLVSCSYDSLEKIITNLLSNAIKYTLANGKIILTVTKNDKKYCEITVKDTGIGIPDDRKAYVFETFARIESTQSPVTTPGTGIGLSLVKELVEFHDGSINLESQLGEGSTFTVILPLFDKEKYTPTLNYQLIDNKNLDIIDLTQHIQQELQTDNPAIDKNIALDDKKPALLIIEDNPGMRQYLIKICSPYYQCLEAINGKQGSKLAIEYIPDIVLSDLMMPEMDGLECLQVIKGDRRTCHIPVILLTSLIDREYTIRALKGNADEIITKPFDSDVLIIRLNNLLSIRKLIRTSDNKQPDTDNADPQITDAKYHELDKLFLETFDDMLEKYYTDENLNSEIMAKHLLMTDRQMQRKVKALTQVNPVVHLRNFRLMKSAELLINGHRIEKVAYDVGFSSRNYFSSCFKEKYGYSPKEYQNRNSLTVS